MRRHLRKIKNCLDLTPPERSFNPDKSTIMLVSYPKSGNTWLRFIFANLIQDSSVGFSNIEKIVPDIYQTNKRAFKRSSYLYVKSHESFITTYNRVVYVVRDPRDVFLSYFNYHKKIKVLPMDFSRELYLKMFLTGDIIESEKFGSWSQHLLSWYHVSKNENVFKSNKEISSIINTCTFRQADTFLGLLLTRYKMSSKLSFSLIILIPLHACTVVPFNNFDAIPVEAVIAIFIILRLQ